MATLSETMTLAGFSARVTAGTLNIGQIYTISDKGWVLQAHSNTVAKPLHGFRMNNGDSLPAGIDPEEIIINTGNVIADTVIAVPTGYYFKRGIIKPLLETGYEQRITIGAGKPFTCVTNAVDVYVAFQVNIADQYNILTPITLTSETWEEVEVQAYLTFAKI